jgi:antitoxin (DNA-binding transcriptional repressor) of toxin-antitoxin stability system
MTRSDSNREAPTQNVTVTELSRNCAEVIDRVELQGRSLVVIRHRRRVALITPVAGDMTVSPTAEAVAVEDLPPIELTAEQHRVLRAIVDAGPGPTVPSRAAENAARLGAALGRLELKGLIEKRMYGYSATARGRAAAAASAET